MEALRRLAPAVAERGTALLVGPGKVGRESLAAWRIVDFEEFCTGYETFNRLTDDASFSRGALFLRIDGPGDIRVLFSPGPFWHLRAGTIRTLRSYYKAVEPFASLLTGLCTDLYESVKADTRVQCYVPNPAVFADEFADLWGGCLATAVEAHHGGALAVVPAAGRSSLNVKFQASMEVFGAFDRMTRVSLKDTAGSAPHVFKTYWRSKREHLSRVARSIGQLAGTDGCVLFDEKLNLLGFGAKIHWPHDAQFLALVDLPGGELVSNDYIEREMGTRHRSAARLVQTVPGAIIFVISQDGELTAFCSDSSKAYRIRHLWAASLVSEIL